MSPIPIILLTGHLGAGKTTVLNHLLGLPEIASQQPALIINEFGTLGVDASLVRPGGWTVYEINKGSLFCVCVKTSFLDTLQQIASNGRPGLVLVEATGVSETRDIETIFNEGSAAGAFRVQANLAVADAANFTKVAAFLKSARSQIAGADGIVINKSDLIAPRELAVLKDVLADLNPRAPQIETTHGRVPGEFVFSLEHRPASQPPAECAPSKIVAVTFEANGPLDRRRFGEAVKWFGPALLRLKGHIDFGEGRRFVELAGTALSEGAPKGTASGTAFTCIGWNVPREALQARFEECRLASHGA